MAAGGAPACTTLEVEMARYRRSRTSSRSRTTYSRSRVRRPTRRRRTARRRSGTNRIVIQLVQPGVGGMPSALTLGKKAASPLLRARY